MERLNWLLLCLLLGTASAEQCPQPFLSLGDHCYFFSEESATWPVARETCQSMSTNDPADLAVFDVSPDDYRYIFNHATALGGIPKWWIGGTDEVQEGVWKWVDGRPIDMTGSYWRPDEPDITTYQNSLGMWLETEERYPRWRVVDDPASAAFRFVCQLGMLEIRS